MMTGRAKPLYFPALRMKAGEMQGVGELTPDVADHVIPRVIIPPPSERDDLLQPMLLESDAVPDIGAPLSAHWIRRDVLIEATYLIDEFGRDQLGLWLPKMFERARAAQVQAIPLVRVKDLLPGDLTAYRQTLDQSSNLQFGLVVSSGDLGDAELMKRALDSLDRMGLSADRCLVIADFHDADLSAPDVVAPIIGAALEDLQLAAPWQQIVFQGTNYPEKNPAEPGSHELVPRSEWRSWREAVSFDPLTADHLVFGDYAADCAKMTFGGGGGRAIRHYRYTTGDSWLVQRGLDEGTHEATMREVCKKIVNSGKFAGRAFSSADDYIYRTAQGLAGPGNAKDWRAVNTTHHITQVVKDVGGIRGVSFVQKVFEPLSVQGDLF